LIPPPPSHANRFNPPPGWPPPPPDWVPPAVPWDPGPSLPPAPANWQFWIELSPYLVVQRAPAAQQGSGVGAQWRALDRTVRWLIGIGVMFILGALILPRSGWFLNWQNNLSGGTLDISQLHAFCTDAIVQASTAPGSTQANDCATANGWSTFFWLLLFAGIALLIVAAYKVFRQHGNRTLQPAAPGPFNLPPGGSPQPTPAPDPAWPPPQAGQLWSSNPDLGAAAAGGSDGGRSGGTPNRPALLVSPQAPAWHYAPPAQPPVPLPPPVPAPHRYREPDPVSSPPGTPSGRSRQALIAAVIVAFTLAAGGGGFALARSRASHPSNAARPSSPAAQASLPAQADSPTQPAPPPSLTPTSTPSPSATSGTTVDVAVNSISPVAPQIVGLLDRYFTAINDHDYSEYSALLDPQMRQDNPPASFASGYGTTTDSAETITGVSGNTGEDLAVTATFTSQQNPADSPDNSSCTNWGITLYLIPEGGSYLIGSPPSTYTPSYQAC
jgi:hypothetical protein